MSYELGRPGWLFLLAVIPVWWWWVRPGMTSGLLVARAGDGRSEFMSAWKAWAIEALPRGLRAVALACLIVALAQPRLVRIYEEPATEGAGIAIAIDLSTSMWADDMAEATTRLEAAKATVMRFVAGRSDDVGLVTFAGEALTRLPLTHDKFVVERAVEALEIGLLIDGTDIAGAIAAGAALLENSPHDSKVLILVTDGAHNRDGLVPATAARAASMFGIRIYPIAIGQPRRPREVAGAMSQPPVVSPVRAGMETVLTQAARMTGGQYFSTGDVAALDSIYSEIDRLETTSDETRTAITSTPLGIWLLLLAMPLILGANGLRASRWGVLP